MEINIKNWEKYNPRKDLKSLTWLRLDSDIGFSESLFGLNAEAKWLWIFLLSFSAKKNKSCLKVDFDYISYHSSVKIENISKHIESFSQKGLIELIQDVPESDRIRTDANENVLYERTNERDEPHVRDRVVVDHDSPIHEHPLDIKCEDSKPKPQDVVDLWNSLSLNLPKVEKLTDVRKKKLGKFLNDVDSLQEWQDIFLLVPSKGFIGADGREFVPSFDFVLEKGRHIKLLEESKTLKNESDINCKVNWDEVEGDSYLADRLAGVQ